MFLTVHSTAGILIGSKITNPFLAFILGLISHLALDMIPHGDESFTNKNGQSASVKKLAFIAAIDTLGVLAVLYFLLNFSLIQLSTSVIAGIIGSILPDYLWGFERLIKKRIFYPFTKLHSYLHNLTPNNLPLKVGSLIQLITFIIFILLL